MDDFKTLIGKVATGAELTVQESASAFDRMMSGEATPSQMGALLMGLRVRGETVDEITGAVTTMRAKMLRVEAPEGAIDVVGTGGDASGSYNISTCAAFILAGGGGRADGARRAHRSRAGGDRPLHRAGRNWLHVRAAASPRHEACRPDAGRTRHTHDLQPARAAVEPGRRQAPDGGRVLASLGRAAREGARPPRLGTRHRGAWLRRSR